MRSIVPLIIGILHVPILTALGFGFRIIDFVAYSGATVGAAEDSPLIVSALAVGLVARRWWYALIAAPFAALVVTGIAVTENEFATWSIFPIVARIGAIVTLAFLANLFVLPFRSRREHGIGETTTESTTVA